MTDNTLSLAERRLAKRGVKITFFKALIKLDAIEARHPDGLEGFIERYRSITPREGLIGVTFPNKALLAEFVEAMETHDIVEGRDIATASQVEGELSACEGITFFTVSRVPQPETTHAFPVWYACAAN
ncbi:MAG: hypothetical protein KTR33_07500 [Gammaproteobacteria bacterium]|nr:hypothetical protein [Gammaproteobacteria bacterium]